MRAPAAALTCSLALLLLAGPPARAASVTVYSGEATQVTASTATLQGSLNAQGQQVAYWFQYGTSAAYGAQTPAAAAGASSGPARVSAPVSGLQPGTLYHFRIVAAGPTGSLVLGADRTLTTRRIPFAFRLDLAPARVAYASPFVLSGTLTGTGAAGQALVLQCDPFPYTGGFHDIAAPVLAGPEGQFEFAVAGLAASSQLRVATAGGPSVASAPLLAPVAVRVSLHVGHGKRRGFARLYGDVSPGQLAAVVRVERREPSGAFRTVARQVIAGGAASPTAFSRTVRGRPGLYRAYAIVSGAQTSGHSRAVRVG